MLPMLELYISEVAGDGSDNSRFRAFYREGVGLGYISESPVVDGRGKGCGVCARVVFEDETMPDIPPLGDLKDDAEAKTTVWSYDIEDYSQVKRFASESINYAVGRRRTEWRQAYASTSIGGDMRTVTKERAVAESKAFSASEFLYSVGII